MRSIQKLVVAVVLALAVTIAVAAPVSAHVDLRDPGHTHSTGGSSGNTIWVSVGASGGAKQSYNQCSWQRGWPGSAGPAEVRQVSTVADAFGALFSSFFFGTPDPADPATVQLVPITEADQDGDGVVDEGFTQPIFTDEDEYVIGDTENLQFLDELLLAIRGTHDLGVFVADTNAGIPEDQLTEEQLDGDRYASNSAYPLIQRGIDPSTGDDLWWDPWFVAIEDQTPGCPAGLIYSPRLNNPAIVLPDLQAYVSSLLPPVEPIMIPTDRDEGWVYVQVPTNFAVNSRSLQPQSAHAEVEYISPGGASSALWADIEAVPTHLVFDPGDGSDPIVCHLSQMFYDPEDPGDCSHVYLDSSNVENSKVFTATVSVLWVGVYTDSIGVSNIVDILPTTTSFDVAVAEARTSVAIGP